jgi:Mrp family chromosome partitioning ATPase
MIIKLLIATADGDYAEHLSNVFAEKYADKFEVSVCSSAERLQDLLAANRFNTALLSPNFAASVGLSAIQMPLILTDETGATEDSVSSFRKMRKYQRVSSIVGTILENYAEIGRDLGEIGGKKAHITAVWSPCGGVGKTTVALAYAAHKVSSGKQTVYLDLENFSSTAAYFQENGKSISKVFEKLEANVQMFLMGIRQQDSGSGISYFCGAENYDDMNILTPDDIEKLINACAVDADELVIDLSSQCDERVRKVFDLAGTVLLVCDPSSTAQAKLRQFISQHNVFGRIQSKTILVNNRGAKISEFNINKMVQLPLAHSSDPISVFKTLSSGNFDWEVKKYD